MKKDKKKDQIFVVHGPNLNLLGQRETQIYGTETLESINERLIRLGEEKGVELGHFFSNHEGELIEYIQKIQKSKEFGVGLLLNPGGYTHSSVALRDAVLSKGIPTVEVHLSNPYKRESFRHHSYFHDIVDGVIVGLGAYGYVLGLQALIKILKSEIGKNP